MTPRGRPRDPELDVAILVATFDLLVKEGYGHLTMEAVADQAGVGKASLYRRWPNKVTLVVDALRRIAEERLPLPDTGTVHGDMLAYLRAIVRTKRTESEVFSAVSQEVVNNPELAAAFRQNLLPELRGRLGAIIQRGVDRGELPATADVELLADLVPALMHHRRLATGHPIDERFVRRVVDQFFPKPRRG